MNAFRSDYALEYLYPEPFVVRASQDAITYRDMVMQALALLHAEQAAHAATRERLRKAEAQRRSR